MDQGSRVYVAGSRTLIGAAIQHALERQSLAAVISDGDQDPDWGDPRQVDAVFDRTRPDYVFVAAGASGGIGANQRYPAALMRDNLLVACHVIESAHRHGVKKLLYLASSCSYPKHGPQPMAVASLLTGALEPTNEAYAVAKLAGMKLCQAYRQQYGAHFIVGIPGDAFGPGDDFHPEYSHVIAALIRKMHEAKRYHTESVEVWGTGSPRRGFIYVDDLADACLFVMRAYDEAVPINLAGPWDVSVREAAQMIKEVVGYRGPLRFDPSQPDGMPIKVLDARPLQAMGWAPRVSFRDAVSATYEWYVQHHADPVATTGLATRSASR